MTKRQVGLWRWTRLATLSALWLGVATRGVTAADLAGSPGAACQLSWQLDVTTGVTLAALPSSLFVGESSRPALSDLVVVPRLC